MGIATTTGVIRDFAGPYYVSVSKVHTNRYQILEEILWYGQVYHWFVHFQEDCMAFGNPTK